MSKNHQVSNADLSDDDDDHVKDHDFNPHK